MKKTQNVSEQKINELTNNWKRALADYQNLERRVGEEKEQFTKYIKGSLIEKLLPVLDSFESVGKHIKDQGLALSIKSMKEILTSEGLKEVEVYGKGFDPNTMQAVEVVTGEEGKVIEVFQKGYMLYNKVIRPAQVKVGKGE